LSANRILLDSNAYFRLADNLKTLLSRRFGKKPQYQLCILGGTLREYNFQSRLRSKFYWVDREAHKEDRRHGKLRLSTEQKTAVGNTMSFMREACRDLHLTCSSFDIECLACALELGIPLVTDDLDLTSLAAEYDLKPLSTLELLKLMFDSNRIDLREVQGTVVMWDHLDDYPSDFFNEFKRLFGIEPERRH
jgi:hypothetical protein